MRSYAIGATVAVIAVLFFTNFVSYVKILLQPTSDDSLCPLFEARAPPNFAKDNSTVLTILHSDEYRMASVENLAGAVRVDTQITDNLPDVADAPEKWAHFANFHQYLETAFPRVFAACDVHKVNTYGLVFHWKGSEKALKPLLLAAHQDVVPVQKDTLKDWTYPPFEGHYDGKYVYGRGASDCKNSLVAVMEAVDLLVKENYQPKRGVLMAFGFDEEASGVRGAKSIAKFIEKKFGRDSIYAIIDEGPGILTDPVTGTLLAAPATGEKGYTDIRVDLFMKGGHSSIPPDHGAVGIIGELAYNMEQDQYSPLLTDENPLLHFMQCLAVHSGDRMGKLQKKAILRAAYDKVANAKLVQALSANKMTKYLIKTSQALDMIFGGEKANALPEDVGLVVNHRVAIGTSVKAVHDHFVSRVVTLAKKYGMDVEAFGKPVYKSQEANGNFEVTVFGRDLEVAPVTPSTGKVWEYLASTTRHVFEDLVLNNSLGYPLVTAPSLMPANTDTKYYWNLTKNIFRYSPMIVDMFENNIHSVNEKILFDGHLQLTAWYYEYIQNVDTAAAE